MPGTKLSMEEGEPLEFPGDEPVHIRVRPFFQLVKKAWQQFLAESKISVKFHSPRQPSSEPFQCYARCHGSGGSRVQRGWPLVEACKLISDHCSSTPRLFPPISFPRRPSFAGFSQL